MILYHNRDVDKHTEDSKHKVYLVIRLMTENIIAIIDYKMLFLYFNIKLFFNFNIIIKWV